MGALEGRVAIITGAGRGIGREHALLFGAEGAKVVVNDLGGSLDGSGDDRSAAQQVADEIRAAGGEAIANGDDISSWEGAQRLINTAVDSFGDLHVLVNNAGILRDRVLVNMTEEEWDAVIQVHMKGHFAPTRWAAAYWRERSKEGVAVNAAVVNTSSVSGLSGNTGQLNYGAAKAAIGAMTIIEAMELTRYGVRVNAVSPTARTRMTLATPGLSDHIGPPEGEGFDAYHPGNVSPLVAYLSTADCPITGAVFQMGGNEICLWEGWHFVGRELARGRFSVAELADVATGLVKGRESPVSQAISMSRVLASFEEARHSAG